MYCVRHYNKVTKNNGKACSACEQTLKEFGYWRGGCNSENCIHTWMPHPADDGLEVCYYCEQVREKGTNK